MNCFRIGGSIVRDDEISGGFTRLQDQYLSGAVAVIDPHCSSIDAQLVGSGLREIFRTKVQRGCILLRRITLVTVQLQPVAIGIIQLNVVPPGIFDILEAAVDLISHVKERRNICQNRLLQITICCDGKCAGDGDRFFCVREPCFHHKRIFTALAAAPVPAFRVTAGVIPVTPVGITIPKHIYMDMICSRCIDPELQTCTCRHGVAAEQKLCLRHII